MSHYDTVDPLERDFIQSWEGIEEFFGLMLARVPWKDRVLELIAELRHAGLSVRQIASKMDISTGTVMNTLRATA